LQKKRAEGAAEAHREVVAAANQYIEGGRLPGQYELPEPVVMEPEVDIQNLDPPPPEAPEAGDDDDDDDDDDGGEIEDPNILRVRFMGDFGCHLYEPNISEAQKKKVI
jgi:hypothetical protein